MCMLRIEHVELDDLPQTRMLITGIRSQQDSEGVAPREAHLTARRSCLLKLCQAFTHTAKLARGIAWRR